MIHLFSCFLTCLFRDSRFPDNDISPNITVINSYSLTGIPLLSNVVTFWLTSSSSSSSHEKLPINIHH